MLRSFCFVSWVGLLFIGFSQPSSLASAEEHSSDLGQKSSTIKLKNVAGDGVWKVMSLVGAASYLEASKLMPLSAHQILHQSRGFKVQSGSLKLSHNNEDWYLFEEGELEFNGENTILKKGILRIVSHKVGDQFQVLTPVAFVSLQATDFLLNYNEQTALLEAEVLEGKGWLKGIYREEEQELMSMQKGGFQGIKEREGPAFDLMLQGRKVVRGQLVKVKPLPPEDLEKLKKEFLVEDQKIIVIPKPKPKPGQICVEPFARNNECVWRIKGNRCNRERCFANGTWGDLFVFPQGQKSECHTNERVGPCNY